MTKTSSDSNITQPPPNAIASGLATGYAPTVLTALNPVELALISKARINQHIFSFSGGSHKKVCGYHYLHYSKVEETHKVEYYVRHAADKHNNNNFANISVNETIWVKDGNTKHIARFLRFLDKNYKVNNLSSGTHIEIRWLSNNSIAQVPIDSVTKFNNVGGTRSTTKTNTSSNPTLPNLRVILAGPFTNDQKALVLNSVQVNFDKCKAALLWLQQYKILYKDVKVDETIAIPTVLDCSEQDMSVDSNIEKTITMKTIFPDHQHTNQNNGGMETAELFKLETVKNMTLNKSKLISRPTVDVLKDYKDNALLKAFVLSLIHI
mgnify:CR=1 FL=1